MTSYVQVFLNRGTTLQPSFEFGVNLTAGGKDIYLPNWPDLQADPPIDRGPQGMGEAKHSWLNPTVIDFDRDGDDDILVNHWAPVPGQGMTWVEHIDKAESWLRRQPRDAALLLALGRLCRCQQLWGKAESYLEASLSVDSTRAAHVELAGLLDTLGRAEEANRHWRAAAGAAEAPLQAALP